MYYAGYAKMPNFHVDLQWQKIREYVASTNRILGLVQAPCGPHMIVMKARRSTSIEVPG